MENSSTLKENLLNDTEKGFTEAENTNILHTTDKSLGSTENVDEVNNLESIESIKEQEEIRKKTEFLKQLTWKVNNLERKLMEALEKTREEMKDLRRILWRIVITHYLVTLVFAWSLSVIKYDCDIKSKYLVLVISAQISNLAVIVLSLGRMNLFFAMLSRHADNQVKIDTERGLVTKVDKMDSVIYWVQLCLVTFVTCAAVLYEAYLGVVAYNCGGQVPS